MATPKTPIRVGIIGLGKMGLLHSAIISSLPNTRLRAVCETDRFIVKVAKAFLPRTVTAYKDPVAMFNQEELDAVIVTTPIATHVPLINQIVHMDPNLSIFVEKPLAASYEQAKVACETVRGLNGVHMVGFHKRFSPTFMKAKELILSHALGDLILLRAYSFSSDALVEGRSWRFQSGEGGVMLDLAPHILDILMWFFGAVTSVTSLRRHIVSSGVTDQASAVMRFESGIVGSLDVCWSMRAYRLPEIMIEAYGKKGAIRVSEDSMTFDNYEETREKRLSTWYRQSFDTSVQFLVAEPEYTKQAERFIACLQERQLPETNFFEAARVNQIIDQIEKNQN